jgi:DeoR family transcriptional regulator of aga operon
MEEEGAATPLAAVGVPAELRQERMHGVIEERGFARVTDLAEQFGVSTVTVRTDLQALEARGRVRRVRGAAMAQTERPFEATQRDLAEEKAHIGRHAATMVSSGETIMLDVGTTTTAVARALLTRPELRDVTVITNSLTVAMELEPASPRITVVLTGGTLRPLQHSLVNPLGTLVLERLRASIAFTGCNGVDREGGVTNLNLAEAEIKRAMMLAAQRRVVVADGSKLGRVALAQVCEIKEVSLVVTDRTAPREVVDDLVGSGVAVDVVD